ncbi:hypothetical protein [Clostridium massiliamazoniense]|uniref:hypothetical protein n=1 Tax=Clostridium massiliamazoniense TaxID=1347366 RepID=UPI0006D806EE|nr:hypothetical protein [Clostridium massiliamazoniense]
MDKNIQNKVDAVYGVVADKHKEDKTNMDAMKEVYKEMYAKFETAKNNNASLEEVLELHKEVFLKSASVKSEDELNPGQKMGLAGHMKSVAGKSAEELIAMDMGILQKFIG